jgi:uridine kinase
MRAHNASTTEWSEPLVSSLVQSRAETSWEGLTAADLVGGFAVSGLVRAPRGMGTQLVVVTGGAASGKSTLAEGMSSKLAEQDISSAIVSSDDFVRWDRGERRRRESARMQPEDKYDFDQMRRAIGAICANQDPDRTVEIPKYDSRTGLAVDGTRRRYIPSVDVLIVEGDMLGEQGETPQALYPEHAYMPSTLYVHVPDRDRLNRRIERDMRQRNGHGETPEAIASSFERRQVTQHLPYTLTYASAADVILAPTPPTDTTGHDIQTYNMYAMRQLQHAQTASMLSPTLVSST